MNQRDYQNSLKADLEDMDKSFAWLKKAFSRCLDIGIKNDYTDDEFDSFELLTSRYARSCDLIFNKVFRSIDKVEFEPPGSIIDVINRSLKREIVNSIDQARALKDLRNLIAHEYLREEHQVFFKDVVELTPVLFDVAGKIKKYCQKYA